MGRHVGVMGVAAGRLAGVVVVREGRADRLVRVGRLAGAVNGRSCSASGLRAPSEVACATSCSMR